MSNIPKKTFRFGNKWDVEHYFQNELDKFPRKYVDGEELIVIAEFGAFFIRPKEEPKNSLTHIMFPETLLGIPDSIHSLRDHSSRTHPQVKLMANSEGALQVRVTAHRMTVDGFPEQISLILNWEHVFFSSDIWDYFSEEDKRILTENSFGPDMDHSEWAAAIDNYLRDIQPVPYPSSESGDFVFAKELPMLINQKGAIGGRGSFHLMPEFILTALERNSFVFEGMKIPDDEEKIPFELGSAHIHPTGIVMSPLQQAIADEVGEDIVRGIPSIPDIAILRASPFANSEISRAYRGRDKNVMETFLGIITVDKYGQVTGSRYFDLGDADQEHIKHLNKNATIALNELTQGRLSRGETKARIEILVEHYRYVDGLTKGTFGAPGNAEHVGDSDYDRAIRE